jgi:Ni,Fe-hydrogenase III large subunit
MEYITIQNQGNIPVNTIPEMDYSAFFSLNTGLIDNHVERHCATYFAYRTDGRIKLICCIADDLEHNIKVSSTVVDAAKPLESFTTKHLSFEKFEREIHENFGINFVGHPWLKPVKYPFNRADKSQVMANYPFFGIESEELHEVGVGPVHAGVIEPGHFRFVCNGEQILHLEIQLGYQHRGVEHLFLNKTKLLQRTILAENIAGDSVIGHTTAFAYLWESLAGFEAGRDILFARTLAQEIERVAIHTGDLSAICTDVAYQLGSSVFGRLRTPIINYFQEWCGNRLAKGLIRAGRNQYPYTADLAKRFVEILNAFEPDFFEMYQQLSTLPSTLSRLERTGALTKEQLESIGTVGMAARMNALDRDIRKSHPYGLFSEFNHEPVIKHHGDVYSRTQIRKQEVQQSLTYIKQMLNEIPGQITASDPKMALKPNSFAISLTEGWRGEICHAAITDANGELAIYKIKDPSFHNWLALALAVRNNEISDFPICNKSFNLSYCGHDL